MKDTKCADCPAVLERREADAGYRATVLTRLDNYDTILEKLDKSIVALTLIMQTNFNSIYFRIGAVSGGVGLITGTVAALATLHLNK